MNVLWWLVLAILLTSLGAFFCVSREARTVAPQRAPFDVRGARRHAHSLGLPFPEADGSVSWPGDGAKLPDQLVHDQMHPRRAIAEAGVTGENALRSLADALGLTVGQREQIARIRATTPCATCKGAGFVVIRFGGLGDTPDTATKVRCGDCLAKPL